MLLSQSALIQPAYTKEPIFRLTVDQYHELIRSGKLTENDPVELIEGILVFKMPKKSVHSTATGLARRVVEGILSKDWHYRVQEPVTLDDGEPEPDGAVVQRQIEDYASAHPSPADVALVIEIADTSLDRDRGIKLRSYARAGIPLYWIINLVDRQVEVYSQPDSSQPVYRRSEIIPEAGDLSLILPDSALAQIQVADLLPKP